MFLVTVAPVAMALGAMEAAQMANAAHSMAGVEPLLNTAQVTMAAAEKVSATGGPTVAAPAPHAREAQRAVCGAMPIRANARKVVVESGVKYRLKQDLRCARAPLPSSTLQSLVQAGKTSFETLVRRNLGKLAA